MWRASGCVWRHRGGPQSRLYIDIYILVLNPCITCTELARTRLADSSSAKQNSFFERLFDRILNCSKSQKPARSSPVAPRAAISSGGAGPRVLQKLSGLLRVLSERSWSRSKQSWNALEAVPSAPGALLKPSRGLPERSWGCLEASRSALGAISKPQWLWISDSEASVAPTSVFSMFLRPGAAQKYETSEPSYENLE